MMREHQISHASLCDNPPMSFADLDTAAVARALAQIADREEDRAEAYFERLEVVELPPEDEPLGLRTRREEGLSVRLLRDGRTWMASRDRVSGADFSEALRQTARVLPTAAMPEPDLPVEPWSGAPAAAELFAFPRTVTHAIRRRNVAFPARITVRRHRRDIQVVGPRLVPEMERELYYSCTVELPWGRLGMLLPELDEGAAERLASLLVGRFRARASAPPAGGRTSMVLAPAAAAVLLHETVAHALEADQLAHGGRPGSAMGVELGVRELSVLDDPGASPAGTARVTDDEGVAVTRRWLLRGGVVEQPLADSLWAQRSPDLVPGAARRSGRHEPPGPRSTHLEVLPGRGDEASLLSDADLWVAEISRGRLDPLTGRFSLVVPHARRVRSGAVTDPVGGFRVAGQVADFLSSIRGIGAETASAGAGWCAKNGQVLPVWATTPALRVDGVEVVA